MLFISSFQVNAMWLILLLALVFFWSASNCPFEIGVWVRVCVRKSLSWFTLSKIVFALNIPVDFQYLHELILFDFVLFNSFVLLRRNLNTLHVYTVHVLNMPYRRIAMSVRNGVAFFHLFPSCSRAHIHIHVQIVQWALWHSYFKISEISWKHKLFHIEYDLAVSVPLHSESKMLDCCSVKMWYSAYRVSFSSSLFPPLCAPPFLLQNVLSKLC